MASLIIKDEKPALTPGLRELHRKKAKEVADELLDEIEALQVEVSTKKPRCHRATASNKGNSNVARVAPMYVDSMIIPLQFTGSRYEMCVYIGEVFVDCVVSTVRRCMSISAKTNKDSIVSRSNFVGALQLKNCSAFSGPVGIVTHTNAKGVLTVNGAEPLPIHETPYACFPYYASWTGSTNRFGILGRAGERCNLTHMHLQTERFLLIHGKEPLLCLGSAADRVPDDVQPVPLVAQSPLKCKKPLLFLPLTRMVWEDPENGAVMASNYGPSPVSALFHYESPSLGLPAVLFKAVQSQLTAISGMFGGKGGVEPSNKIESRFRSLPVLRLYFGDEGVSTVMHPKDYMRSKKNDEWSLVFEPTHEDDPAGTAIVPEEDDSEEDECDRRADLPAFYRSTAKKLEHTREYAILGNCVFRNANVTVDPAAGKVWLWGGL